MKYGLFNIPYTPNGPRHAYDPACPDCKPAFTNPDTGEILEPTDPLMVGVMRVWNTSPFKERQAFISVTFDNSRDARDVALCEPLMDRMAAAFTAALDANRPS